MKVYVVMHEDYDESDCRGVFSMLGNAERFVAQHEDASDLHIYAFNLDEPPEPQGMSPPVTYSWWRSVLDIVSGNIVESIQTTERQWVYEAELKRSPTQNGYQMVFNSSESQEAATNAAKAFRKQWLKEQLELADPYAFEPDWPAKC